MAEENAHSISNGDGKVPRCIAVGARVHMAARVRLGAADESAKRAATVTLQASQVDAATGTPVAADAPRVDASPMDLVLCVDTSSSMAPHLRAPSRTIQACIHSLLEVLPRGSRLALVTFNTAARVVVPCTAGAAGVAAVRAAAAALKAEGYTNTADGLLTAMDVATEMARGTGDHHNSDRGSGSPPRKVARRDGGEVHASPAAIVAAAAAPVAAPKRDIHVLVLTDGETTTGHPMNDTDIIAAVAKHDAFPRVRMHCIGFGTEEDPLSARVMATLAERSDGAFHRVVATEDTAAAFVDIVAAHCTTLATRVTVRVLWTPGVAPVTVCALRDGEPYVVLLPPMAFDATADGTLEPLHLVVEYGDEVRLQPYGAATPASLDVKTAVDAVASAADAAYVAAYQFRATCLAALAAWRDDPIEEDEGDAYWARQPSAASYSTMLPPALSSIGNSPFSRIIAAGMHTATTSALQLLRMAQTEQEPATQADTIDAAGPGGGEGDGDNADGDDDADSESDSDSVESLYTRSATRHALLALAKEARLRAAAAATAAASNEYADAEQLAVLYRGLAACLKEVLQMRNPQQRDNATGVLASALSAQRAPVLDGGASEETRGLMSSLTASTATRELHARASQMATQWRDSQAVTQQVDSSAGRQGISLTL